MPVLCRRLFVTANNLLGLYDCLLGQQPNDAYLHMKAGALGFFRVYIFWPDNQSGIDNR